MHELYFHRGFSESNFKAIQKEELCGLPSFKAYLRLFNIIKQSNLGDKDTGWSRSDFKDVIHHCLCCYSSSQLTKACHPHPNHDQQTCYEVCFACVRRERIFCSILTVPWYVYPQYTKCVNSSLDKYMSLFPEVILWGTAATTPDKYPQSRIWPSQSHVLSYFSSYFNIYLSYIQRHLSTCLYPQQPFLF